MVTHNKSEFEGQGPFTPESLMHIEKLMMNTQTYYQKAAIVTHASSNDDKLRVATKLTLLDARHQEFTYAELVEALRRADDNLIMDKNIIGSVARELGFKRKTLTRQGIRKRYYYFPKLEG